MGTDGDACRCLHIFMNHVYETHVKVRTVSILPVPESKHVALSENNRNTGNEQRYIEQ
jgi:hypothetical protein